MTTADVNVSCPHCRQEYRLRIDLERLMRLRSRVVCSRCRKAFDVASRLGSARSTGRSSVRPSGSVPPATAPAASRPSQSVRAAAATEPPASEPAAAVVPPGTSLRAAVEIDARGQREPADAPYAHDAPYASADILETVRTIPPDAGNRKPSRIPLGAPPPPPPSAAARRALGMPPPIPGGPPRRITPKMFAAVVDVAEVPVREMPPQNASTAPPQPLGPSSETPPPGPTEPTPESVAKWLGLADPGLRALTPQERPASEALERLVSG